MFKQIIKPFTCFGNKIRYSTTKPVLACAETKDTKVNILTLDLETRRLSSGELEVISGTIYDGKDYHTFYITDYISDFELLEAMIKTLLNFNNYKVYIHNSSNFDLIFLFKHILNLEKDRFFIDFIKREDKFIKIDIKKFNYKSYIDKNDSPKTKKITEFSLTFYDSYLILPNSLSRLAKAFNLLGKLSFDVAKNDVADLKDLEFMKELLEYNKQDCKLLYDIIISFNNLFIEMFKLSILDSPTLPSLAFKLFTTTYLQEEIEIT
jgi:DNA polymerase elongation subunit (family B)